MSLANLKVSIEELTQLTPVMVKTLEEARALGIDPSELQHLADQLTEKVAKPLAVAIAGSQPVLPGIAA